MVNRALDLDVVLNVIKQLKALDLRNASIEEIKHLLKQISTHLSIIKPCHAGTIITRAVPVKDKIPALVTQISYNPNPTPDEFGRATYENTSAFYGCIDSEIMKPYFTSGMEVLKLKAEGISRQIFIMGKWILQEDCGFLFLGGGNNLLHLCKEGYDRHQILQNHIEQYPESLIALKSIDTFLCEEFSKEVSDKDQWEYKISATYSQMLREEGHKGLIFPSVKSNGAGVNIVLFPEAIDNNLIKLELATYTTYYLRDKNFINDFTLIAYPDEGILRWKDLYTGKIPPKMKAYYIGDSDDKSFMDKIEFVDLNSPIKR